MHAPVEATPMYVQLYGPVGEPLKAVVVLRRPDGKPLKVTEVITTNPAVKSVVEPVTDKTASAPNAYPPAKPGDVRVTFTADPAKQLGRNVGNVKIATNHPEKPELNLGLAVEVVPIVRAVPPQIDVLRTNEKVPGQADSSLMHQAGKAFRVREVELRGDLPGCTARVLAEGPAGVQAVRIEANGPLPPAGIHHGVLIAKTDLPGTPEIEVPVMMRVSPPPVAPLPPGPPPAPTAPH